MSRIIQTKNDSYLIEGYPKPFHRFSYIADQVESVGSDPRWAAATIMMQGIQEVISEACEGELPRAYMDWCDMMFCTPSMDGFMRWLTAEGTSYVKGRYQQKQQSYADRGTIVDKLFQHLVQSGPEKQSFAEHFVNQSLLDWAETARLDWEGYIAAKNAGVVEEELVKPARGPQCSFLDVIPYAETLVREFHNFTGKVTHVQELVIDEKRGIAGHPDAFGSYEDAPALFEVKTNADGGVRLNYRAQIAMGIRAMREKQVRMIGVLILVTPEKFVVKPMSDAHVLLGCKDADNVIENLGRSSMRGCFERDNHNKKKKEVA